jgi:hypothetical protein
MHKNFKNVAIHLSCHEKARFIANITGLSIADVVEELVSKVFDVAVTYEKANLEFETSITGSKVTIEIHGRNRLVTGSFQVPSNISEAKETKEIRKRIVRK